MMGREQRDGYPSSGRSASELSPPPAGPAPGAVGRSGRPKPLPPSPKVVVRRDGRFTWAAEAYWGMSGQIFRAWSRERAIRRAMRYINIREREEQRREEAEQVWP